MITGIKCGIVRRRWLIQQLVVLCPDRRLWLQGVRGDLAITIDSQHTNRHNIGVLQHEYRANIERQRERTWKNV